jgi:hypothetical protein
MLGVRSILIAIVAACLGCIDSTGPVPIGPKYVLESVGGEPLPALTMSQAGATETAVADTLLFDIEVREKGRVEHHEVNGYLSNVYHATYALDYVLKDGVLSFLPNPCPPGADCIFAEHTGRFAGDKFIITYADSIFRTRTYRRLSR